jgi:DNA-binding FrmR family transcriptional regulator
MKQTLRERMENILCRIVGRIEILQKIINEYKECGDFENAIKCDIKMRTFKLIEEDLRKELQS